MTRSSSDDPLHAIDDTLLQLLEKRAQHLRSNFAQSGKTELGSSELDSSELGSSEPNSEESNSLEHRSSTPTRQHWEEEELRRLCSMLDQSSPLSTPGLRAAFREIFRATQQREELTRVAYLGPAGTYSHMAARAAFGSSFEAVETGTIPEVFEVVERGLASYGIVPIENSTAGGVQFTLEALLKTKLQICGELVVDVEHCLLARHSDMSRIKRVLSHPQPLAQCKHWLAKHAPHLEILSTDSTTAAAKIARERDDTAAIASVLAAELEELQIIHSNINDSSNNATRFVTVANADAAPTGTDKTSFVFATKDEPGALCRILTLFQEASINLSRIESLPRGGERWQYLFYVDFSGHRLDPKVSQLLAVVQQHSEMVRIFGSYPKNPDC